MITSLVAILVVLPIVVVSFGASLSAGCKQQKLLDQKAPYGGEVLPPHFFLTRRTGPLGMFQVPKVVNVHDSADGSLVGAFYDVPLYFFRRFAYVDATARTWFQADYPSFLSNFWSGQQYSLHRCDARIHGRRGAVYDVTPRLSDKTVSQLHVERRADSSSNRTYPDNSVNVAFVSANSFRGGKISHKAYMNMTSALNGSVQAVAHRQTFTSGSVLSNWTVDVKAQPAAVPNWVIGFMAALDATTDTK